MVHTPKLRLRSPSVRRSAGSHSSVPKAMSSASGATETEFNAEERSRNRAKLVSANVPAIVYERGMSFYSPDSDRVREYLQSGAFKEDSAAHRGIYLCGNNPKRSDIFATVAKVLVLNDLPVYFTSLHGLVGA